MREIDPESTDGSAEAVHFHRHSLWFWRAPVGFAVLAVLSVALIFMDGGKAWEAGVACLLVSVWAFVTWAAREPRRGPIITVGPEGFLDRRLMERPVPWEKIDAMMTYRAKPDRVLGIGLVDLKETSRLIGLKKKPFGQIGRLGVNDPIQVTMSGIDGRMADLLAAIQPYLPEMTPEV